MSLTKEQVREAARRGVARGQMVQPPALGLRSVAKKVFTKIATKIGSKVAKKVLTRAQKAKRAINSKNVINGPQGRPDWR